MSTLEDRIQQLELENAELREKLSRKGAGRRPLGKQRMSAAEYRARHKAKMLEAAKQEEEARNTAIRAAKQDVIKALVTEILPTIHTDDQMRVIPSGTPESSVTMLAHLMDVETDQEEIKRRERAAEVDRLAATLALSTTITGYDEPEQVTIEIEPELEIPAGTPLVDVFPDGLSSADVKPKPFAVVMCGCRGCEKCFRAMGSDECQRYAKFPVLEPAFCFECFEPGKESR